MKLAIVIGHSRRSQGAVAVSGVQEWRWNATLAGQIQALAIQAGIDAATFERRAGPYNSTVPALARAINAWGADLVISLHFDSSTNPAAHGTSVLHWPGSKRSAGWAAALAASISRALGTRNRGAIAQGQSWSGAQLWILSDTRCPAVIIESHFGSNAADHTLANAGLQSGALAAAIVETLTRTGI